MDPGQNANDNGSNYINDDNDRSYIDGDNNFDNSILMGQGNDMGAAMDGQVDDGIVYMDTS